MSGQLLTALVSPVVSLLGGNLFGSKPKSQAPQPVAQMRPPSSAAEALQLRRGSRANSKTGAGGAEAGGDGGKTKLGA